MKKDESGQLQADSKISDIPAWTIVIRQIAPV